MTPNSPTQSALETLLFRLCIVLKVVFWTALTAMLVKGMWATATGRELADPTVLFTVVAVLAGMQLGAWFAWWRVRRARQRGDAA